MNTVDLKTFEATIELKLIPVRTIQLGLMGFQPVQGVEPVGRNDDSKTR